MSSHETMWKGGFQGGVFWGWGGGELWILTIWSCRRGRERKMICLTDDFNKDVAGERGVSEITS